MKKIFAANWKLHKTPQESREFFRAFLSQASGLSGDVIFFPSASSWEAAADSLNDSPLFWGAQNIWSQAQGAYTGENSAAVLQKMGGRYVLIGHSERRQLFKEDPSWMAEKVAFAQSLDLTPVLCIGETLEQRQAGLTDVVNATQLDEGLSKASAQKPLIVAYEPVWAIGTGQVATPEQVKEAHQAIHEILVSKGFAETAILYGGSVKPDNAKELLGIPHVDGFLVGGASLEPESFLKICRA